MSTSPAFNSFITNITTIDTNFTSTTILNASTVYYWRVLGINKCGDGVGETQAFVTQALACTNTNSGVSNIPISGSGTPTVEFPLEVTTVGVVSDLNVKLIKAEHSRTGDLVVSLIAPSGKTSLLWSKKCSSSSNVNVSLDDQSPLPMGCPINSGKIYRPEAKLDVFNGEAMKGIWKLKVEDQAAGQGGKLTEFNMEICGSVSLKQPFIVKNETLKIYPNEARNISAELLKAADDNNTDDQLIFTVVNHPSFGKLYLNGVEITIGSTFSQVELNNAKLSYKSTSSVNVLDKFLFTVTDGTGGWINITAFNIDVNLSNPSGTYDDQLASSVFVHPNPTSDNIEIILTGKSESFKSYSILDMAGRVVNKGILVGERQILSLENLVKGIYVLSLSDGQHKISKKIIKI